MASCALELLVLRTADGCRSAAIYLRHLHCMKRISAASRRAAGSSAGAVLLVRHGFADLLSMHAVWGLDLYRAALTLTDG